MGISRSPLPHNNVNLPLPLLQQLSNCYPVQYLSMIVYIYELVDLGNIYS